MSWASRGFCSQEGPTLWVCALCLRHSEVGACDPEPLTAAIATQPSQETALASPSAPPAAAHAGSMQPGSQFLQPVTGGSALVMVGGGVGGGVRGRGGH